jgi:hypothetical protein
LPGADSISEKTKISVFFRRVIIFEKVLTSLFIFENNITYITIRRAAYKNYEEIRLPHSGPDARNNIQFGYFLETRKLLMIIRLLEPESVCQFESSSGHKAFSARGFIIDA